MEFELMKRNKILLVTGVAGFLGRYIASHFFSQNWQIIGLDGSPPEKAPLDSINHYYSLRLPASQELQVILEKHSPDAFVHCAGIASVGLSMTDPLADFQSNTSLTFDVLNSLRLYAPQCQFILCSSAAVYGNPQVLPIVETTPAAPISPYGFHKLQSELLCLEFFQIYSVPTASLRIFSAYGIGLKRQVVWDICKKALLNEQVILQGTGRESRDFIHALDIARSIEVILSTAPMEGECYNLANGEEVTIAALADMILENLKLDKTIIFDGKRYPGTPRRWHASITKLQQLNFVPSVPLKRGIEDFSDWVKSEL
jgi:UDP-glucose 4-epimerase